MTIGLLRAAYDSLAVELLRVGGTHRRAVLVGEGEGLLNLHRTLGASRAGIGYVFLGAVSLELTPGLAPLGPPRFASVLRSTQPDELVLAEENLDERTVLRVVETAHRSRVIAPTTTELLVQRGEYVPGQGVPLFDAAAARAHRRRLGARGRST